MKETGISEEELKSAIKNVNGQINQVKLAISSRKLQDLPGYVIIKVIYLS
jgi:hypothetical protein